jgi:hypothetical protein
MGDTQDKMHDQPLETPETPHRCCNCWHEIHSSDAVRYGYGGASHEASRCIQLLELDVEAANTRVAELEEELESWRAGKGPCCEEMADTGGHHGDCVGWPR